MKDASVESGSSVTWEECENIVAITVTNAGSSNRKDVTVTKEKG